MDFKIHGCPINNKEFAYIVRCLAMGKTPVIPNYPVCVECKMRENVCRYEYNEVCLGPVTRAGLRRAVPVRRASGASAAAGYVDDPNVNAAATSWRSTARRWTI